MLSSFHLVENFLALYVIPGSGIARKLLPGQTFQKDTPIFENDKKEFQENNFFLFF